MSVDALFCALCCRLTETFIIAIVVLAVAPNHWHLFVNVCVCVFFFGLNIRRAFVVSISILLISLRIRTLHAPQPCTKWTNNHCPGALLVYTPLLHGYTIHSGAFHYLITYKRKYVKCAKTKIIVVGLYHSFFSADFPNATKNRANAKRTQNDAKQESCFMPAQYLRLYEQHVVRPNESRMHTLINLGTFFRDTVRPRPSHSTHFYLFASRDVTNIQIQSLFANAFSLLQN